MNYSVRNIVIAVGLALCAIVAVLVYTSNVQSKARSGEVRVKVLVATRDIAPGTTFEQVQSGHMLAEREVLQTDTLPGVLTQPVVDSGRLAHMVVAQTLYTGMQVPSAVFAQPLTSPAGLRLQNTDRAISFPFDKQSGLIGTIHAGDHVDVLACFHCGNNTSTDVVPVSRVLLRDIEVLSVPGSGTDGGIASDNSDNTIMLKATDVEASKLLFAQQNARTWLVVRPKSNGHNSDLNATVESERQLISEGLNAKTIKKLGLNAAPIGSTGSIPTAQ